LNTLSITAEIIGRPPKWQCIESTMKAGASRW
jgi:hypothetical protein